MNDPRNEKEPEMFFCTCEKCKGDSVGYEYNDMLDPYGECISRWCANLEILYRIENEGPEVPLTSAEYELRKIGATPFYLRYYQAPLEPFIKPDQVDELFEEIAEMGKNDKLKAS